MVIFLLLFYLPSFPLVWKQARNHDKLRASD
jgi:hypothetical protein